VNLNQEDDDRFGRLVMGRSPANLGYLWLQCFGTPFAEIVRQPNVNSEGSLLEQGDDAMAESFKDKAKDAGHKVAEKATEVGHEISEKAGQAKDWAKKEASQVGHKAEEAADAAKKKVHEATK
jgi:hypothetical protein